MATRRELSSTMRIDWVAGAEGGGAVSGIVQKNLGRWAIEPHNGT